MVNGVEPIVVTQPMGARAPAPHRITAHSSARVDQGDGFAPWLVAIPVISLMMVGFLIMMLSTFVAAPPLSSIPLSSDGEEEEVRVELPVIDEIEIGETTVSRAGFSR
jgi:hypothetical protein